MPRPPASQKGSPSSRIFARSTTSRSPYTGSPVAESAGLPRGGALWPPAVGPSMMKPSTRPFALRWSVSASVFDAMIGRNRGRFSAGAAPSIQSAGEKRIAVSSPSTEPVIASGYSAASWRTNRSRMPGTRIGIPAPIRTAATPASIAP